MADIQVFFNRPLIPIDLTRLHDDLRTATYRVAIASAWFTDTAIAEAFIASPASNKVAVFNQHDIARGSRKAVEMVQAHIAGIIDNENKVRDARNRAEKEIFPTWREDWSNKAVSIDEWNSRMDLAVKEAAATNPLVCIGKMGVVGSKDWQNGIMHHKFIVADDVVWFGSFNFTYNAKSNYETLVRVEDESAAMLFWVEIQCVADDAGVWDEGGEVSAVGGFLAKCGVCLKMIPANKGTYIDSHGTIACPQCSRLYGG